jgi:hypothetical protein
MKALPLAATAHEAVTAHLIAAKCATRQQRIFEAIHPKATGTSQPVEPFPVAPVEESYADDTSKKSKRVQLQLITGTALRALMASKPTASSSSALLAFATKLRKEDVKMSAVPPPSSAKAAPFRAASTSAGGAGRGKHAGVAPRKARKPAAERNLRCVHTFPSVASTTSFLMVANPTLSRKTNLARMAPSAPPRAEQKGPKTPFNSKGRSGGGRGTRQ